MSKPTKPMTFGKTMWAATLGVIIAGILGSIVMTVFTFSLMIGVATSSTTPAAPIINGSYLKLDLADISGERSASAISSLTGDKGIGLNETVAALQSAADDERVKGLFLQADASGFLSWGSAKELRDAVLAFARSGKKVVAYGSMMSQPSYYVASAADFICVHPSGMLDFRGIGGEVMYYKDLLDKLGVQMQLIRPESCSYKSAGEIYTMNRMSPANREQIRAYTKGIWHQVVDEIGTSRQLTSEQLNEIADNLSGMLPQDALKNQLVDTLCFYHNVKRKLENEYGANALMPMSNYIASWRESRPVGTDKIAIVYAEGNVMDGEANSLNKAVYGDEIVKALDKARKNKNVKAIVLRINSSGGAVTASESMTDAVWRAKMEKPVVVSMSDVAASAGYEIACNANKIVAQPTTITGSIGVFATYPNLGGMLKSKLGITTDTVLTNRNATGLSTFRPLSPAAMSMMMRNVEEFYVTFVQRVATGRRLEWGYVDSIARGRVWTGADAMKLGLVDTLGGLQLALQIAAEEAGIVDYSVVEYPREKTAWEELMLLYGGDTEEYEPLSFFAKMRLAWQWRTTSKMLKEQDAAIVRTRLEQDLLYISEAQGLQARLPFVFIEE